jgi:peptidoglycan/LPS O-acetylase OafA/YrhL
MTIAALSGDPPAIAGGAARSTDRIVALDGVRGVACLAVVISHYFGEHEHGVRVLAQGWAGVELFFCLSGFLIGGILIDNRDSPSYFRTFYWRRAFRIFPIYYVVISLVLLASALLPFAEPTGPPYIYYTYTLNFALARTGSEGSLWLLPTWTLCVEEQFYILFPLFLFMVPARWRLERVLLATILAAVAFRGGLIYLWHANGLAVRTLLPDRMDALFLGVLGAYARRTPELWGWLSRDNRFWLKALTLASIAGLPLVTLAESLTDIHFVDVFGWTFGACCFTGLVLLVADGAPEADRFRWPILCYFGSISYCLYLIHQPVAGILHGLILGAPPDAATPAQIAVSLLAFSVSAGLAALSWVYFERPLLRYARRWKYDPPR